MNAIQNIRKNVFGLTQVEFSVVAGVTQASVSRWEKHDVAPSLDEMTRIRQAAMERDLPWNDRLFFEVPEVVE
ncbi:helix-turn-helix domain-containing protein [Ensifer sp. PDNC004]|uniref:helix-turn-helix domain-containing protein n=1 Tax=Ensifer sp. PDNC004 TaxID=2811423 RepID=UPI001966C0B0|nr:helix-turn-helix domain-containing protein [Ensifer sp. PDNC004]QRY68176.1 helix-turn-helix domain-containing protein [Ensifer sp. PDNC004]